MHCLFSKQIKNVYSMYFFSKKKNHKKVLFHQFKIYFYFKKDVLSLCDKTTYKIKCIYVVLQYIITGCLYKCSDVDCSIGS